MLRQAVRTALAHAGDRTPSPDAWGLVLVAAGVEPTKAAGLPGAARLRLPPRSLARAGRRGAAAGVGRRAAGARRAGGRGRGRPRRRGAGRRDLRDAAARPGAGRRGSRPGACSPRRTSAAPAPAGAAAVLRPGARPSCRPTGSPARRRRPRPRARRRRSAAREGSSGRSSSARSASNGPSSSAQQQSPAAARPAGPPAPQRPQSQQRPRPQGKAPRSNRWVAFAGIAVLVLLCGCGVFGAGRRPVQRQRLSPLCSSHRLPLLAAPTPRALVGCGQGEQTGERRAGGSARPGRAVT